jgi:hypothetical protein
LSGRGGGLRARDAVHGAHQAPARPPGARLGAQRPAPCSALLAAYAGWRASSPAPARAVTWAIGVGYFALGCYGWFTPGLLLGTPLAIPLGVPENLFHLLLSVPALAIVLLDLRSARPRLLERG